MGLIKQARQDDAALNLASQLATALRQANLSQRVPDLLLWAKEFTLLAQTMPIGRIQAVLEWYCKTLNQPYSVQARSAKLFRLKFDKIEAQLDQIRKRASRITITPQAKRCAELLTAKLTWPGSVREVMPALIQLGWDRLADFDAKLARHQATLDEWHPDNRFLIHARELYMTPHLIEEDWLPMMHAKYCRRNYFGDPMQLCFNWKSDDFRRHFWWEFCADWIGGCEVRRYDPILDTLIAQDSKL